MSTKKKSFKLSNYTNYIIVSAFTVLMVILSVTGVLNRTTTGILTPIAYSIILAVSLNLVVGFLGELSLGHAGFMCVGGYIGCYLSGILSEFIASKLIVLIISLLIGGCIAAVFGLIIGWTALRLKGDYLAIVTLAFGEIVRNLFKNIKIFNPNGNGLETTVYKPSSLFIIAFITLLILLFIIQNLIRSKHGRAITAIRDNEIAAKSMGINITFYKLLVFVIAAFCAGVAGVLYGNYVTPMTYSFFSYNYSIEILVMVVLGGMGNITGSIIAAATITYINSVLQNELSGDLASVKTLVYALILIFIVLYNNAPVFRPLKEKMHSANFIKKIFSKKHDPSKIRDDEAQWDVVPTKIKMDEVLSVDLQQNNSYTPDKPGKEKK